MPTYGYDCANCGEIEIFHSIMDDPKTKCPECGQDGLERQISCGSAVIMRGKAMNQYNDVHLAKYWKDKQGRRHKVQPSDGHSKA